MLNAAHKVSVIILNWNGKNDTLACLESLTHVTYPHLTIYVVDNGSTDGSAAAISKQFPSAHLIENPINSGFAEGNNIGIRAALKEEVDFIFLLNNDTIVAPDLLEHFIATFDAFPQVGILGAHILLYDQKETLDHLGGMWNSKKGIFDFIGLRQPSTHPTLQTPQMLDYVCGAGMIIRRQVIETIGLLEPLFFLIWEESDFCSRAKKEGFLTMSCPKARLWHKVSASFVGGKPHSTYFWWRNRLLWIERNCSLKEQLQLYFTILLPEISHMIKIRILKKTQLFFLKLLKPKKNIQEKEKKLLNNQAALCGVRDYFLRRFGNGPQWIYKSHITLKK